MNPITFTYQGAQLQTYTVTTTGTYVLDGLGAQGGGDGNGAGGGSGAGTAGSIALQQGDQLLVLVGKAGGSTSRAEGFGGGGGGGGTFVYLDQNHDGLLDSNDTLVLAAGAGGGGGVSGSGGGGRSVSAGSGSGSGGAGGGNNSFNGGGGAGVNGAGGTGSGTSGSGAPNIEGGGTGLNISGGPGGDGGYGGGGGGGANGGGGGGGFSGGAGGSGKGSNIGGQGGTSFFTTNGTVDTTNSQGSVNSGNGSLTLTLLTPPTNLTLDASTDSGTQGDNLTNVATAQIDGNATAGATVTLYDGNTIVGTTTATAGGTFQIMGDPTLLIQGANNLTATASPLKGGATSERSSPLTVTLDSVPPTVSSPTDTVAPNSAASTIGITAPTDAGTPDSANLTIDVGMLPTDGTVTLADGTTAVATGENLTSTQLTGLKFTPTSNVSGTSSTFAYTVTDPAQNSSTGTATLAIAAAVTPAIMGTTAGQTTANDAPISPFKQATVTDGNNGTDTLSVQLTSGGANTGATGTLAESGGKPALTSNGSGLYTLATGSAATVQAELQALVFTPTPGAAGSSTTTGFTLVDQSSVGPTSSAPDSTTTVIDTDAPAPAPTPASGPSITGTHATSDTGEATVQPFGASTTGGPVTITDGNAGAMDSLAITFTGGGGTLTGSGLTGSGTSYSLAATDPGTLTAELDALTFTPTAGAAGVANPTTFTLAVASNAGTNATDSGTVVTDTAAATPTPVNPTPVPTPTPQPTPISAPTTDTVSINPTVTYANGVFTLTGTTSSTAGVSSVEISAVENYGARVDLGTATVNADGTFTFQDNIGANLQGFIQATETDSAGGTATSADPLFSLTGGLGPNRDIGRERQYTADGEAVTAATRFGPDGTRTVAVKAQGQTFASGYDDTFNNAKQADTTFVFTPGFSLDVVNGFKIGGNGHDTLSFKGTDFGTTPQAQLGALLANSYESGGSFFIVDPTTQDAVQLKGVTTAQFARNERDITFHA